MRPIRLCLSLCLLLTAAAAASCGGSPQGDALEGSPPEVEDGILHGVTDMEYVIAHFPVFRSRTELVSVPPATVRYLRELREPVRLKLFMGTWCHDAQVHVPHLFQALQQADNSRISLQVVGMDRQKGDRDGFCTTHDIAFSPTLVVEHEGGELGRVVEVPADDMASDLVAILRTTLSR
ncbi:MAG: thioredoxin family protein [bacterium]